MFPACRYWELIDGAAFTPNNGCLYRRSPWSQTQCVPTEWADSHQLCNILVPSDSKKKKKMVSWRKTNKHIMSCGRSVSGKHIHLPAIYFFRLSPVSRSSAVGSEQKISFGEAATWIFCSLVFLPLVCLLEIPGGVEEYCSFLLQRWMGQTGPEECILWTGRTPGAVGFTTRRIWSVIRY
jgi:hypothetical protein